MKNTYSIRSFLSYMSRFKARLVVISISFLVSNIFLALIPVFIGRLVGSLAQTPLDHHAITQNVIVLIACSTFHNWTWRISEFLYLRLSYHLLNGYENIVFDRVIRKPYPYFVDKFTGKVASYVTTLGEEFHNFVDNIFWNYINAVVRLVSISAILLTINRYTGLLFLGAMVLMLLVGRITIRNSTKYEKLHTDVKSTKNGKIIDAIANFVNVKSFQKEKFETDQIIVEQNKTIAAGKKSFFWNVLFWASMSEVVRNIIWPSTIILNIWLFYHHKISLAEATTLLSSVLLFSDYIWGLIWNFSQFNLKRAKIEESHQYLFGKVNIITNPLPPEEPSTLNNFDSAVQLHKLSFAYPDKKDNNVLHNIALTVKKNEKIGIVGRSGSGKTTLTKLLLGYYDLPAGEITVDGKSVSTQALAGIISYVPQDTTLFHRSIAENIAYATNKKVSRAEVVEAAKKAHAHEFITQISEGYEALVGERGVKLSTGQRQRIAIARAFLDEKPLLILDEATSALDSESERLVQDALEALWQEKTVIAIAHRLSTLRHMDRIVVFDKGKIIEQGSHEELIKQRGAYYRLWQHQNDGMIVDSND